MIAGNENFGVIHSHDWVTYPSGISMSQKSCKAKEIVGTNDPYEESKFRWEDSAAKVMKIYEEVIGKTKGREG